MALTNCARHVNLGNHIAVHCVAMVCNVVCHALVCHGHGLVFADVLEHRSTLAVVVLHNLMVRNSRRCCSHGAAHGNRLYGCVYHIAVLVNADVGDDACLLEYPSCTLWVDTACSKAVGVACHTLRQRIDGRVSRLYVEVTASCVVYVGECGTVVAQCKWGSGAAYVTACSSVL